MDGGLDPAVFGRYSRREMTWAIAVINEAQEIRQERTKALVEAIGASVGNVVAKRIAEMFR